MELEREIGLPRSTIYAWKQGKSRSYKSYIVQIANYFNITTDYFFDSTRQPTPNVFSSDAIDQKIRLLQSRIENIKDLKSALEAIHNERENIIAKLDFEKRISEGQNAPSKSLDELKAKCESLLFQEKYIQKQINECFLSAQITPVNEKYHKLNKMGRVKVQEYIEDLIASGKYAKKIGS